LDSLITPCVVTTVVVATDKIKTALREEGLFWLTYLPVRVALVIRHPNKKNPTFSKEVGFGRRVRGNAITVNILGGILLEM
jgi:hypothetical protein